MKHPRLALVCVLGAALLAALVVSPARAEVASFEDRVEREPEPSRGIGAIVVGSAGLGISLLNLATLPVCSADFYPDDSRELCRTLSFVFAGTGALVAAIALPIGFTRNARWRAWRERNRGLASLTNLSVGADAHRVALTYGLRF